MTDKRIAIDWYCMRMPYEEKVKFLKDNIPDLIHVLVNHHYNTYCGSRSSNGSTTTYSNRSLKKRIPCINCEWGDVDFSTGKILIGRVEKDNEYFIGFMTHNRWSRPQRVLTGYERVQVLQRLDRAMSPCTWDEEVAALKELWDYMQTLTFP